MIRHICNVTFKWAGGGSPLINWEGDFARMGARARGAIAISSPVTLLPKAVPVWTIGSWELCIFCTGFLTAVLLIVWILSE